MISSGRPTSWRRSSPSSTPTSTSSGSRGRSSASSASARKAFAIQAPLRPGINVFRSPWWANLLPHPATQLETGDGAAAPPLATTSAGAIP